MITLLASCVLAACGGGSSGGSVDAGNVAAGASTTPSSIGAAATSGTGANDQFAATIVTGTAVATTGTITRVDVASASTVAQTNVPVTFGQVFKQGDVPSTGGVVLALPDGSQIPFQVDVKARHPDGSIRHAVFSLSLASLPAGATTRVSILKTDTPNTTTTAASTPAALLNAGFTASANFTVDGVAYSASADALLRAGTYKTWLSGPVVNEWIVSAPLKTAAGTAHPHLTARFAIRHYAGSNKARVDVTVENDWAYEPSPRNFVYDASVKVGGNTVFSQAAMTHFHHARWRKLFWWGAAPATNLKLDSAYLIATKAVPNYDTGIIVSNTGLSALDSRWNTSKNGPMGNGVVTTAMPMVGGRPDIGPLPQWGAMYVLSMDPRAAKVTMGVGDLAGSWPIHYRDKRTDRPVSLNDFPYMTLLGHASDAINPATGKSELFPACGGDCTTTPYDYKPDANHQPSMAYVPYVVTGDYYYLEELHFWANFNMIQPNPAYRGYAKGLMKSYEIRGQAWSLRTMGQAAYITPDNDPMKKYFADRVGYNLSFYNTAFTNANPNQLGVLDGSSTTFASLAYSTASGSATGLAPWQDDFFTWSVGYLAELGFSDAVPLLNWKAKFPIGRMTAPGFCWIDAATYALTVRPSSTSPLFTTFADAYQATMRNADGTPMVNSTGARYLDQPCGSQAQADWRTQKDRDTGATRAPWLAGEMPGYATSPAGYPSNMQPALAVAATTGLPNAQQAWTTFINRSVKPDYTTEPQWAIVPRK